MSEEKKHIFVANHIAGGHHDLKYYNFPSTNFLIRSISRPSREWNHISDIIHSSGK